MKKMEKLPAIEGGNPTRSEYLIFGKPEISEKDIKAVLKVLKSGWLSTGPYVQEFEQKFKEYVDSKHTIAVNSCTSALHLALISNNIGKKDEVVVSPITFGATINVIIHAGATPVFVDIEKDSYNIDSDKIIVMIPLPILRKMLKRISLPIVKATNASARSLKAAKLFTAVLLKILKKEGPSNKPIKR